MTCIENITKNWFDAKELYNKIRQDGKITSPSFWHETAHLLNCVSGFLSCTKDEFMGEWNTRCENNDLHIMAYHCTRAFSSDSFLKKGLLPLSEETLEEFLRQSYIAFPSLRISDNDMELIMREIVNEPVLKIRLKDKQAGPHFFLSYLRAKEEDNNYLNHGPENWWSCVDILLSYCAQKKITLPCTDRAQWIKALALNSTPFILVCILPFSLISARESLAFIILVSFFNYIDPDPDSNENSLCEYTVRLYGKALNAQYIVKIERVNVMI